MSPGNCCVHRVNRANSLLHGIMVHADEWQKCAAATSKLLQSFGDIGDPNTSEQIDYDIANARKNTWTITLSYSALILCHRDVSHVMHFIFNCPVATIVFKELLWRRFFLCEARDSVDEFWGGWFTVGRSEHTMNTKDLTCKGEADLAWSYR